MAVQPEKLRMVKTGSGATSTSRTIVWKVRCDQPTDTAAHVYDHAVTPKPGSGVPANFPLPTNYRCKSSEVTPDADTLNWFIITSEYAPPTTVIFSNPLDYVRRGGGGADNFVDVDDDIDGNPIKNSAGDFVDPPFQRPEAGGQFWVEFRATSLGDWPKRAHVVATNDQWGLGALKVRTGSITWEQGVESGVQYWQIRVNFLYKAEGWRAKWRSRGFNWLDSGTRKAIRIQDPDYSTKTVHPTVPQPLNASGLPTVPEFAQQYETKLFREENMSGWTLPNPFNL